MTRTALFLFVAAISIARPLSAQHDHGQLGRVVFPISCNAAAQRQFERAMAALHSFWWEEGQGAFQAVATADSS